MEATMTVQATHRPLEFGRAFAHQFRFLNMSRRPLMLGVALLGVLALGGEPWNHDPLTRFFTLWPVWVVLAGPFWAFAVFHNEGPSERLYHWAQPVGRWTHTAARLCAGLAWLWLLLALLLVAGILAAVADGDAGQFAHMTVAGWVNYFTGPLLGYMMISVLTVASDHPIRWFFGIIFMVPITVTLLSEWLGLATVVRRVLGPLGNPYWGLGVTLAGGFADGILAVQRAVVPTVRHTGPAFDAAAWWTALPLWTLLLAAVVAALAVPHPDAFPRLRWRR